MPDERAGPSLSGSASLARVNVSEADQKRFRIISLHDAKRDELLRIKSASCGREAIATARAIENRSAHLPAREPLAIGPDAPRAATTSENGSRQASPSLIADKVFGGARARVWATPFSESVTSPKGHRGVFEWAPPFDILSPPGSTATPVLKFWCDRRADAGGVPQVPGVLLLRATLTDSTRLSC